MKARAFGELMERIQELTPQQRERLRTALAVPNSQAGVPTVLERAPSECPHCGAHHPVRYGHVRGQQRWRCHACQRTFGMLTGTPLMGLHHKSAWTGFAQAMSEGLSVRKTAKRCGIHRDTAFRWRHRFLALPAEVQAKALSGIVEVDETLLRQSEKGRKTLERKPRRRGGYAKAGRSDDQVCVLVARDRSGRTLSRTLQRFDAETVNSTIGRCVDRDAVLCTDAVPVYQRFARERDLAHEFVNLSQGERVRERVFHIQNVNAYDRRLKQWLDRFHGVATKYLDHYLGWFRMLDSLGEQITPNHLLVAAVGRGYQYDLTT